MEFQVPLLPFLSFHFFSAFLRGHYPEQVRRVISQLQAGSGHPLPWPIQFFLKWILVCYHVGHKIFSFFIEKRLIC